GLRDQPPHLRLRGQPVHLDSHGDRRLARYDAAYLLHRPARAGGLLEVHAVVGDGHPVPGLHHDGAGVVIVVATGAVPAPAPTHHAPRSPQTPPPRSTHLRCSPRPNAPHAADRRTPRPGTRPTRAAESSRAPSRSPSRTSPPRRLRPPTWPRTPRPRPQGGPTP